jgi:chemotaxis protein MotB
LDEKRDFKIYILFGKDLTMRTVKLICLFLFIICISLLVGCVSEQQYKELQAQNAIQVGRITRLSAELDAANQKLDQLNIKLEEAEAGGSIDVQSLRKEVSALEQALAEKKAMIARMSKQLLGGVVLPVELSVMLEEFANSQDMVTYDASRGLVKFKSDLLFEKGSSVVASESTAAVKSLCGIMNSTQGLQFDIIVAGHTDDMPIRRAETKAKHPDNWYLSAHRGISVLEIMTATSVDPKRVSVRGFGQYRPVEPNAPGNKGNPQNRRVEIYIVPQGT